MTKRAAPLRTRAQRLSASEIRHSVVRRTQRFALQCSTPFGIRDSTPRKKNDSWYSRFVLNAFRHQRFDTATACNVNKQRISAQRLSASEIRHFGLLQSSSNLESAQRLSASEIRHPMCRSSLQIPNNVLNAFRHQRFDTLNHRRDTICVSLVLNAFRHQRFDTYQAYENVTEGTPCSTPFGIRDSTQHRTLYHLQKGIVLNAFRHQRFDTVQICL